MPAPSPPSVDATTRLAADIIEQVADAVICLAPDGTVMWASPSTRTVLGWQPADVVGTRLALSVDADGAPGDRVLADMLRSGAEVVRERLRSRRSNGELIWVDTVAHVIRNGQGEVERIIASVRDVTVEVARQEAELDRARRFQVMAENAVDVVFHTVDGVTEWVSPSLKKVTGWDPQDIVGGPTAHLWHPGDRERAIALRDSTYSGQPARGELRFRRKDGSYVWLGVSLKPYTERDGRRGAVGIMRDIDDRVHMQQALALSETRYQLLAENASDVVYSTDCDSRVTWMSPAVTRVLGWSAEELIGTDLAGLVHPDDIAGTDTDGHPAQGAGAIGQPDRETVLRFRSRDGSFRWMSSKLTRMMDEAATRAGFVGGLTLVDDLVHQRQRAEIDETRLRALLDTMIDPFMLLGAVRDRHRRIVDFEIADANLAALAAYGVQREQLIGQRLSVLHPAAMETELFTMYVSVVEEDRRLVLDDWAFPRGPQQEEVMRYDLRAVKAGDAVSQTWRDVSERHAAGELLAKSEEHFRLLAENSTDIVLHDAGGVVQWLSPSVQAALGWDPSEWIGRRFEDFTHPDDAPIAADLRSQMRAGQDCVTTIRLRNPAGDYHWAEVHAGPYEDEEGRPAGVVASFRVVDREVAAREQLTAAEEQYRLLAQNSTDVVGHARNGRIVWISPSVTAALGGTPEEWIGVDAAEILHPDDLPGYVRSLAATGQDLVSVVRARIRGHDGHYHWIEANTGPFINASGVEDGVIASIRVIDELVEAESAMAHSARFDALTGLMNREEILQRLGGEVRSARRPGEETAVLFCDIDEFKRINDSYGHAAGDEVLRRLAERIGSTVRHEDAAARIGGDEFLIVLTGTHGLDEAVAVAEKIRESAAVSMGLDHHRVNATLSIGVTILHPGESIGDLIAHADQAMYEAKKSGRNRVVSFA